MPTYVYKDSVTNEIFEIYQRMADAHLVVSPLTGNPCRRQVTAPVVMVDTNKPRTVGALADKNTEKMIKEGKIKPKKKEQPFWRTSKKPLRADGWSPKQKEKYIMEGKKP
jgi:hypothetical protein